MNGIIDAHIFVARYTKMCASVIPFIPFMKRPKSTFNSQEKISLLEICMLFHQYFHQFMYTHRKKLSIILFFSVTKAYKKSHFLSPDHTENFRACIWAAKIIEVRRISFLSYGGYKMPQLNSFNIPKCRFAFSILHSTEDNFGKST